LFCITALFNKGKWEFPGGKLEPGETLEECITRTIQEELGAAIGEPQPFMIVEHSHPDFRVRLHSFFTRIEFGSLMVKEHRQIRWVEVNELMSLDWAEADVPIVEALLRL